ncbi:MAG TPA: nuclear transport factor 2 family protein [Terriglobales bacterium]|nr:nuclear transport factor 2 family protein [Terriglobales bacterium]
MFGNGTKLALSLLALSAGALAQSRWATADDLTAKYIIESERQWAESGCTHNGVEAKILADDFQGTSPKDGSRYTKKEELAQAADTNESETDCRLLDAKVRFFRDNLAIVYGDETATPKGADSKPAPRCLTWTDTWLERDGKWQIIAAQDAQFPCK